MSSASPSAAEARLRASQVEQLHAQEASAAAAARARRALMKIEGEAAEVTRLLEGGLQPGDGALRLLEGSLQPGDCALRLDERMAELIAARARETVAIEIADAAATQAAHKLAVIRSRLADIAAAQMAQWEEDLAPASEAAAGAAPIGRRSAAAGGALAAVAATAAQAPPPPPPSRRTAPPPQPVSAAASSSGSRAASAVPSTAPPVARSSASRSGATSAAAAASPPLELPAAAAAAAAPAELVLGGVTLSLGSPSAPLAPLALRALVDACAAAGGGVVARLLADGAPASSRDVYFAAVSISGKWLTYPRAEMRKAVMRALGSSGRQWGEEALPPQRPAPAAAPCVAGEPRAAAADEPGGNDDDDGGGAGGAAAGRAPERAKRQRLASNSDVDAAAAVAAAVAGVAGGAAEQPPQGAPQLTAFARQLRPGDISDISDEEEGDDAAMGIVRHPSLFSGKWLDDEVAVLHELLDSMGGVAAATAGGNAACARRIIATGRIPSRSLQQITDKLKSLARAIRFGISSDEEEGDDAVAAAEETAPHPPMRRLPSLPDLNAGKWLDDEAAVLHELLDSMGGFAAATADGFTACARRINATGRIPRRSFQQLKDKLKDLARRSAASSSATDAAAAAGPHGWLRAWGWTGVVPPPPAPAAAAAVAAAASPAAAPAAGAITAAAAAASSALLEEPSSLLKLSGDEQEQLEL